MYMIYPVPVDLSQKNGRAQTMGSMRAAEEISKFPVNMCKSHFVYTRLPESYEETAFLSDLLINNCIGNHLRKPLLIIFIKSES